MTQSFTTTRGKVFIERNILFMRTLDLSFSHTIFYHLLPFTLVGIFITHVMSEPDEKWHFRTLMYGVLMCIYLPRMFGVLFKKSFANRIPVDRIVGLEMKEDPVGLEVFVELKLKSGRTRTIAFRKLENQAEPFMEAVSGAIAQPQFS